MSTEGRTLGDGSTPAYVTRFDGVRVAATDYHPVWLESLADDNTIEGSAMNGVVQGAEAVRSIVTSIRKLYESQDFNFAGPYGENGFLEDYTAQVRGGGQVGNKPARLRPGQAGTERDRYFAMPSVWRC
jgi:hypothetical protein